VTDLLPRDGAVRDGAYLFPVRVYYEDTDAAGLVYYANYLKFAERARTEMLRRLGVEQERLRAETGLVFVVRRCAADYLLPARLDDDLIVETRLKALGGASLDLDQDVRRGDALLVRLVFQIACLGQSGRPQRLPPVLRAALGSLNDTATRMVTAHAR
jgi:acyl-CoA thioester hydrolase